MIVSQPYVYFFGGGKADGHRDMKDTLGGKGAGLAEMTNAGLPVPPGFTVATEVCNLYFESGNKVPDLLDEARWELEFLLKMQVPAGRPYAGMAHHKIHEDKWTKLPHDPAIEAAPRYLHRPSTAAGCTPTTTSARRTRTTASAPRSATSS